MLTSWYQIVKKDVAQPTKDELDEALVRSRKYWFHLASLAYTQRDHGLAPDDINPRHALHRVPKFQARPKKILDYVSRASSKFDRWVDASSTWKVSGAICDGLVKEVSRWARLQLGVSRPLPLKLDGEVFSAWNGTTEEKGTGSNYLGILTLGWCYVLSARLLELRGEGVYMRYTETRTECNSDTILENSSSHLLDIGEADEDVARWWSAILAPGEGWEALVTQNPKESLAPWCVKRICETSFSITYTTPTPSSPPSPLSSKRAFEALAEFALLHELGSQFPIALAAALTFPLYRYYALTPRLPLPRASCGKKSTSPIGSLPQMWLDLFEDLPYYMTLSCDPELMMATFCGSFWEPGVPCNMVSPWLHTALKEVLAGESTQDQEILALMCAIRRPNISALLIGAAIGGLGPSILRNVEGGHPPMNPNGFAWTGCLQSFMDITGSGPYTCENPEYIQRQDAWRLLHLPTTENDDLQFNIRPLGGAWAPCGISPIKNCALRVRSHLACSRHEYQYDHWSWELEDCVVIKDYGFSRDLPTSNSKSLCATPGIEVPMSFEEKEFDVAQEASETASWQTFHYFFVNGEGLPPEEIYHDEWIKPTWADEESEYGDDEVDDHKVERSDSGIQERVQPWLDSTLDSTLDSAPVDDL